VIVVRASSLHIHVAEPTAWRESALTSDRQRYTLYQRRSPALPWTDIIWIDGPGGNVAHIAEHGISTEEVEDVLDAPDEVDTSNSSGRPIAFGYARSGRYLAVVFEQIDTITVYPITEITP
jgi:uncharacterized DUF497 family protein